MKTYIAIVLAVVGSFGSFGCASETTPDAGSESDDSTATQYIGIRDFNNSQFDSTWIDVQNQLAGEFADVCGDSFCEGDFSNLTPLSMNCAVSTIRGEVHDCVWAFAGSLDAVDEDTSVIHVDAPTFPVPLRPEDDREQVHRRGSGNGQRAADDDAGHDGHDLRHARRLLPAPHRREPDHLRRRAAPEVRGPARLLHDLRANQTKWQNGQAALKLGFDNICGDTYCDGDFGDIQSMDFNCSVTKSTGKVKSCVWNFAGSYSTVGSKGTADDTSKAWSCPVTMNGTISQLITTLTAGGDPIPVAAARRNDERVRPDRRLRRSLTAVAGGDTRGANV